MRNLTSHPHPGLCPHPRRGRRRRSFLQALQQSQAAAPTPAVEVGRRLREIRSGRGLSIRDLARSSGLNVNTLSMIENGKNSPSLETLQQLSLALKIPITAFFEESAPKSQIAHYQANQRPSVTFAHGALEDLSAGLPRRGLEAFLVTLSPRASSGARPMVHTGREGVFCLEGQLTYTVEEQVFVLNPGDSLFFEAHLPHCWRNESDAPARSLLILCPADEQDRPTERHFAPPPGNPVER